MKGTGRAVWFRRGISPLLSKGSGDTARHLTISLLIVLVVFSLFQFEFDSLRGLCLDLMYRTQWWRNADPAIEIIGYDQKSSIRYSGSTKIPVQELVRLLKVLKNVQPKSIGIFAPINQKSYSDDELTQLASAMSSLPQVIVGYTDDESLGKAPPAPLRSAGKYLPGMVSRDNFSFGADGVTRRVMIAIDGFPTAYAELARHYLGQDALRPFRNEVSYMGSHSKQTFIHWNGVPPVYTYTPSRQVAEAEMDLSKFKDKVVLIGNVFPTQNPRDFILTPYSRDPWQTPYIEGVAESLATLIHNNGLARSSYLFNLGLSLLIGIFTVNLVLVLSPIRGIFIVLVEFLGLAIVGWIFLFAGDVWLDLAHPAATICIAYYLVIPYRLLSEYRTRWHYQEKSELMAQLEQLKSNFLSLVSHDLKTPIARIQGSAEVLLNSEQMDEKERRSLVGIVKTTEELSDYVQTILDLTRIESAGMPLQKASKDINMTLKEVADQKRAMAAEKNINISTKLEPMFSFKFDPKLIQRVISNLVENAIKYSPENTNIIIGSKEDGDWIRVTVTDEGHGIALEEQQKVFEKFFRGKGAENNQTKGSGLGLYLVKYFVELHRGAVELRSELGKGSTFTVSLPV